MLVSARNILTPALSVAALTLLLLLTTTTPATKLRSIDGPAYVLDGDTVVVGTTHVRLKGVDAAELGTALGENAKAMMMVIVTPSLSCRLTGEKTWDREVGYCSTSDGVDINRAIIERGFALACPGFDPRYLKFEQPQAVAVQTRASYCIGR
jgi:endonuclease YncB( thermonuclease family)